MTIQGITYGGRMEEIIPHNIEMFLSIFNNAKEAQDFKDQLNILSIITKECRRQKLYKTENKYLLEALDVTRILRDKKQELGVYDNLVTNAINQKDHAKAVEYLKDCVDLADSIIEDYKKEHRSKESIEKIEDAKKVYENLLNEILYQK